MPFALGKKTQLPEGWVRDPCDPIYSCIAIRPANSEKPIIRQLQDMRLLYRDDFSGRRMDG